MKRTVLTLVVLIFVIVLIVGGGMYFSQENFIFFPEKLDRSFTFEFEQSFEEIFINRGDGVDIHGLLFKAVESKGLIFYLHGNAGSLRSWGGVAAIYTELGFDIFMLDYRGYGKSGGRISSEEQFYSDVQAAYDEIRERVRENRIVVLGYSIGSGPAARVASDNGPKLLILQAPYVSLIDMMKRIYPLVPSFLLKYKFRTDQFIQKCGAPVVIFHGDCDEVIDYNSSLKLQILFKKEDRLVTLTGQTHNGMTDNPEYKKELTQILKFYFKTPAMED